MILPIDTDAGILIALDRDRFAELIQERREAAKDGPLRGWVVLGKLILSSQGGCGEIESMSRLPSGLLPVVSLDDLRKVFGEDMSLWWRAFVLPPAGSVCPECSRGWPGRSIVDVAAGREAFFHSRCRSIHARRVEREYFEAIFRESGLKPALAEMPNQYDGGNPSPWFLASLPECDITIGWRKRVISIELDRDCGFKLDELVADNVTKDHRLLHAYGYEKAVEYLKLIAEHLR